MVLGFSKYIDTRLCKRSSSGYMYAGSGPRENSLSHYRQAGSVYEYRIRKAPTGRISQYTGLLNLLPFNFGTFVIGIPAIWYLTVVACLTSMNALGL